MGMTIHCRPTERLNPSTRTCSDQMVLDEMQRRWSVAFKFWDFVVEYPMCKDLPFEKHNIGLHELLIDDIITDHVTKDYYMKIYGVPFDERK